MRVDVREITFRSAILDKRGQDFVLNSVSKVRVVWDRGSIFKRQHRDAFLGNAHGERCGLLRKRDEGSDDRGATPAARWPLPPSAHGRGVSGSGCELSAAASHCRIRSSVEVHDRDAHAVLDFAGTEIMQQRSPAVGILPGPRRRV